MGSGLNYFGKLFCQHCDYSQKMESYWFPANISIDLYHQSLLNPSAPVPVSVHKDSVGTGPEKCSSWKFLGTERVTQKITFSWIYVSRRTQPVDHFLTLLDCLMANLWPFYDHVMTTWWPLCDTFYATEGMRQLGGLLTNWPLWPLLQHLVTTAKANLCLWDWNPGMPGLFQNLEPRYF